MVIILLCNMQTQDYASLNTKAGYYDKKTKRKVNIVIPVITALYSS